MKNKIITIQNISFNKLITKNFNPGLFLLIMNNEKIQYIVTFRIDNEEIIIIKVNI